MSVKSIKQTVKEMGQMIMKPFYLMVMLFMCLFSCLPAEAAVAPPGISSDWRFQKDPGDRGVEERWHHPDFDDSGWSSIEVPKHWSGTWAKGHLGYAWYRTEIALPDGGEPERLILGFGAVDEQAWVYINGVYVGEHTVESEGRGIGRLWNRMFMIGVDAERLNPGRNLLAVRVHASAFDGGIHQPVRIYRDGEGPEAVRPANQAQVNALKRIAQLAEIKWEPVLDDTLPSMRGTFSGRTVTGVPYSSVRGVGRWIGYDVSFETFMTALQNPKSVLYTENLSGEPYNVPNSSIYYGLVCSSFVQYAFRDDLFWNTSPVHNNPEGANMSLIEEQSADGVELLAILNTIGGGHQEIVTGIYRLEGEVVSIEITDLSQSGVSVRNYRPAAFNKFLNDRNYLMYRYDIPDDLPYTPSKYVAVGDEEAQEIIYNQVLALDRGNKTNYVKDSPVKFNIMDADADLLIVSKESETVANVDITGTGVIEKNFSECGHYSAHCVMKDGSSSDMVEFIVAEVTINFPETVESGEDIRVEFTAQACRPRYIMMQHPRSYSLSVHPPRAITEQEISEGAVTISLDRTGSFYVVVNAVNEFGGVYSRMESITVSMAAAAEEAKSVEDMTVEEKYVYARDLWRKDPDTAREILLEVKTDE